MSKINDRRKADKENKKNWRKKNIKSTRIKKKKVDKKKQTSRRIIEIILYREKKREQKTKRQRPQNNRI